MQLRILSLNIWGVHYVAKYIRQRIQALIEHLNHSDTDYDIVGLQEVSNNQQRPHFIEITFRPYRLGME
jgi:endonuclease/exonuclease/phosphatase family metal-dependent hydrolase